ncbi:zinc-binding protein A33-like isoform X1 [Hemiscyllium ocellatum]|uniref:zinc-binding protein A33-like isoform X1 n=2 Tax=Hemiscyllium ocellatum TaxID=170820 RepID=UPI002966C36B|nr:zinc-binding protein A33-like isoform X1 [Hemiscyllium ocellatum]
MPQAETEPDPEAEAEVEPAGEGQYKGRCEQHGEALRMYCAADRLPVCTLCTDTHRDHHLRPISDAVRHSKNELRSTLNALKERKTVFTEIMYKQQQKISALTEATEALTRNVSEEFAGMRRFLDRRERELKKELAEQAGAALEPLEDNLRSIQRALISIQKDIISCQATANQRDSLQFLQEASWLRERPREEIPHPSVLSARLCPGLFKGPLQYWVWKEMKDNISPVPASLTLDPGTASPWLVLLEDLTGAALGGTQRRVEDGPLRFDHSPCVLASQGFASGRHYWEVAVRRQAEWAVGLTRETARRKGAVTLSPQDGYWAVWRKKGDNYRALTSPPTRLDLAAQPGRLGIYLDYEGGQVSFYDAERTAHLYTFTGTFTERLYPFFSPGPGDGHRGAALVTVRHLSF